VTGIRNVSVIKIRKVSMIKIRKLSVIKIAWEIFSDKKLKIVRDRSKANGSAVRQK